jgi:hypothetical protein
MTTLHGGSRIAATSAVAALLAALPLHAQLAGTPLPDRVRLAAITGDSTLARTPAEMRQGLTARMVGPSLSLVYNSHLPYSLNHGPLWAGRGTNAAVSGGVAFDTPVSWGRVSAQVAPAITWSQNKPFQIYPWRGGDRSSFASPFYPYSTSADLPMRFGSLPLTTVHPGESHVTVSRGRFSAGFSTEQQWWGPSLRNTLVMSNNAPGIPRLFVRAAPVSTRVGSFEGQVIAGTLTESIFFDTIPSNDHRSVSGILLAYRPRWEPLLTLGFSRVVYRPASGPGGAVTNAFDVLTTWTSPRVDSAGRPDGGAFATSDQILSFFLRWVFPESGFEFYGEWARSEVPRSMAEFLRAPHNSQGYTGGFQLARPLRGRGHFVRLQAEATYLDQNSVFPERPVADFYSGRASVQGYTNRGQVVGAAIGPGGSSQWLGVDRVTPLRDVGAFVGRIRWNTDAFYREPDPQPNRRDVTVLMGLRGSTILAASRASVELTLARRLNYLFQNDAYVGTSINAVDVRNLTLAFRVEPR